MNAAQEIYGEGRLKAELGVAANASPQELVSAVKLQVDAFSGAAPKTDDVTMLALRWRPP